MTNDHNHENKNPYAADSTDETGNSRNIPQAPSGAQFFCIASTCDVAFHIGMVVLVRLIDAYMIFDTWYRIVCCVLPPFVMLSVVIIMWRKYANRLWMLAALLVAIVTSALHLALILAAMVSI
jgi:hypothetical protein